MGHYCLTDLEFPFCKMKSVLETASECGDIAT